MLICKSGEMVRFIPGSNMPFTVKAYEEDLGVSYHAIVLYLLPYEDLNDTHDEYADLPPSALEVRTSTSTFLLDKYV